MTTKAEAILVLADGHFDVVPLARQHETEIPAGIDADIVRRMAHYFSDNSYLAYNADAQIGYSAHIAPIPAE